MRESHLIFHDGIFTKLHESIVERQRKVGSQRIRFPWFVRGVTSDGKSFGPSAVRTVIPGPAADASVNVGEEAPLAAALRDQVLKAATEPELANTLL